MTLHSALAAIIAEARRHGHRSLDLATLERLLRVYRR